jgi:hypothetical protein
LAFSVERASLRTLGLKPSLPNCLIYASRVEDMQEKVSGIESRVGIDRFVLRNNYIHYSTDPMPFI